MHIWKEGTLKCSGLKVYSVVSGKERLFFQQMKALKKKLTSCQTNCYTGTQLFLKSHQHNKTYLTQYKMNFQITVFVTFEVLAELE